MGGGLLRLNLEPLRLHPIARPPVLPMDQPRRHVADEPRFAPRRRLGERREAHHDQHQPDHQAPASNAEHRARKKKPPTTKKKKTTNQKKTPTKTKKQKHTPNTPTPKQKNHTTPRRDR